MCNSEIKSTQNLGSGISQPVGRSGHDRGSADSSAVKLEQDIVINLPSDSVAKSRIGVDHNVVQEPTRQELDAGLKTLRNRQIKKRLANGGFRRR